VLQSGEEEELKKAEDLCDVVRGERLLGRCKEGGIGCFGGAGLGHCFFHWNAPKCFQTLCTKEGWGMRNKVRGRVIMDAQN
jgi:hypothetical protein